MTPSSSWLAPFLTLLTLGATLGVILDSNHRAALVVATIVIVAITFALSIRQRVLKRPLDWTLSAPSLLGLTTLAAESFTRLETPVLLLFTSVLTYFFGRRERTVAGAADATAGVSLQIVGAFLAFLAIIGGTRAAPVLLIVATIWLLVWMPSRTRHVHDQDTLHIARGPAEVSAYLLDQRHLTLWYPGYVSCELEDGETLGAGSTFRQVIEPRGRAMEAFVQVDEYESGHRLCTHVMLVPGRATSCYSFSPEGPGTVVAYEFDSEQLYPSALIGSMMFVGEALRKVRTQRHQAFDKLKSILEA